MSGICSSGLEVAGSRSRAAAGRPRSARRASGGRSRTRRSRGRPRRGCRPRRRAASSTPRRAPPRPRWNTTSQVDALLARDRVHQHQQFTVHWIRPPSASSLAARPAPGAAEGREPAPLEIDHRHEPGLAHLVEREVQRPCLRRPARRALGRRARRGGARLRRPARRVLLGRRAAAVGASTRRQPASAAVSSPRKRLRPLNGSFSVISTCSPRSARNRRRSSAAGRARATTPRDARTPDPRPRARAAAGG